AFVGADPRSQLHTLRREEAVLELTVVGDVEVRTRKAFDNVGKHWRVLNILVDEMMDGRSSGRDRLASANQGIHRIRDAADAHHIDARDLDDSVGGGIDPGGFNVDDADQGGSSVDGSCGAVAVAF